MKCSCGKNATFGLSDASKPTCCKKCKTEGMIDLIHKKYACVCGKQPNYGLIGDLKATCCKECKTEDMVNLRYESPIRQERILKCACGKYVSFGLPDGKACACKECKTPEMISKNKRKCPCGKQPNFGLSTDSKPTCCKTCKTDEMVNLSYTPIQERRKIADMSG